MTQTVENGVLVTDRPVILVLEGLSGASEFVEVAGGDPLEVSPHSFANIQEAFDEGVVDGVLLTGGGDVNPKLYNQTRHARAYGISEVRDWAEFTALELAEQAGIPVMGICRGAQIINVHAGGSLHQHLPDRDPLKSQHQSGVLAVRTRPGSRVREAFGQNRAKVMHLHHQAVARPGVNLRVSAWHKDGTVEAIESTTDRWVVGVQFHPEYAAHGDVETGLFRQFILAAAKHAGLSVPAERRPMDVINARNAKSTQFAGVYGVPGGNLAGMYRGNSWDDYDENVDWQRYGDDWSSKAYLERDDDGWPTVLGKTRDPEVTPTAVCHLCHVEFDVFFDFEDHMWIVHKETTGNAALRPSSGVVVKEAGGVWVPERFAGTAQVAASSDSTGKELVPLRVSSLWGTTKRESQADVVADIIESFDNAALLD